MLKPVRELTPEELEARRAHDKARRLTPKRIAYNRAYYQRPEVKARNLERGQTPHRKFQQRMASIKKLYGLTQKEYEAKLQTQNGLCAICHKTNGKRDLCVDHDHKTGDVRGLLCDHCNIILGLMKEDPQFLIHFAAYLNKWKQ